ncbi:MAG TPA: zinc ribbon domain-containing protein [Terriglobales bacterium]|jgi:hypothetical protein
MAFCNSCGTPLDAGTKFCNKCGAAAPAAAPATAAPAAGSPAPAAPSQGSGALKVILIIVGIIVLLGILAIGGLTVFGIWIAKKSHVEQRNGKVSVQSPFGNVEATQDPEEVAKALGEYMYPGARPLRGGASSATFGSMHTVSAQLETDDGADKVAEFYRSKFPNANYSGNQGGNYTIVSGDQNKTWTTITINPTGQATRIQISRVTRG